LECEVKASLCSIELINRTQMNADKNGLTIVFYSCQTILKSAKTVPPLTKGGRGDFNRLN